MSTENPYAIFDKNSIKEGDYISHPPPFILYQDVDDDKDNKQLQQPRQRAVSANNYPIQLNNSGAGRGQFRGSNSRGANRQFTPTKFQRSDGGNRGGSNNRFNPRNNRSRFNTRNNRGGESNFSNGERRNYSNSSSHSYGPDDVFMSSNAGYAAPNSSNHYYPHFPTNDNFAYGMPPPQFLDAGNQLQNQPYFPIYDMINFPPLHYHPNPQKKE